MKGIKKAICALCVLSILFSSVSVSFAANESTTQSYLYSSKYSATLSQYTAYNSLKNTSLQFAIPGISNGTTGGVKIKAGFYTDYIPQGITYENHTQKYYMTAYSESKQNSVIFVLSAAGKYERTLEISNYTAHAGGIASDGRYLYIVSGLSIYYIGLDAVKTALKGEENTVSIGKTRIAVTSELCQVNVGDKSDTGNQFASCSFCTYFNGLFWFGEFSLDTQSDDYPYRSEGESYFFGVDLSNLSKPTLKKVMTVPCKTQGAAFFKDSAANIYLACSMSYGRNNASTLRFYKPTQSEWGTDSGEGKGTQSKTGIGKFVHKNNNIKNMDMPNLMEDICIRSSNNKLYLLSAYESGAKKYASSASYVMDRVSAIDINSCLNITTAAQEPTVSHLLRESAALEATCTTDGYIEKTCAICNEQTTTPVAAKGHDYTLKIENENTLAEDFEQEPEYYYTCRRCAQIAQGSENRFLHTDATIYGHVDMSKQQKEILVELIKGDETLYQKTVQKSANGVFVFRDAPQGVYTVRYSGKSLLPLTLKNVVFDEGNALAIDSAAINARALPAGDVNADGVIDIADLSMIMHEDVYRKQTQTRAEDINADGRVDIGDVRVVLLESNYAQTAQTVSL